MCALSVCLCLLSLEYTHTHCMHMYSLYVWCRLLKCPHLARECGFLWKDGLLARLKTSWVQYVCKHVQLQVHTLIYSWIWTCFILACIEGPIEGCLGDETVFLWMYCTFIICYFYRNVFRCQCINLTMFLPLSILFPPHNILY